MAAGYELQSDAGPTAAIVGAPGRLGYPGCPRGRPAREPAHSAAAAAAC